VCVCVCVSRSSKPCVTKWRRPGGGCYSYGLPPHDPGTGKDPLAESHVFTECQVVYPCRVTIRSVYNRSIYIRGVPYNLGIGEDPLAESHVDTECQAISAEIVYPCRVTIHGVYNRYVCMCVYVVCPTV